jgi:hypothetical protein
MLEGVPHRFTHLPDASPLEVSPSATVFDSNFIWLWFGDSFLMQVRAAIKISG